MMAAPKKFKFGWYGDGGLGERLILSILAGEKTATCSPIYDPEDAELRPGDRLELTDKRGRVRGTLAVTRVETRTFGSFDEALAAREGGSLEELRERIRFANGRDLRPDEEMRVVHFQLVSPPPPRRP